MPRCVCRESEDPLPRMTLDPGREGDDLLDHQRELTDSGELHPVYG